MKNERALGKSTKVETGSVNAFKKRGLYSNHGKGDIGHEEFESLDHGGKHDHMAGRTGRADPTADDVC